LRIRRVSSCRIFFGSVGTSRRRREWT